MRLEIAGGIGDIVFALLSPAMREKGDRDDDEHQQRVDHRHGREAWRMPGRRAAETILPEQQERFGKRFGIGVDVVRVVADGLGERRPGNHDREQDHDVADFVHRIDERRSFSSFMVDGIGIGEPFRMERPVQIDVDPELAFARIEHSGGEPLKPFG